MKKVLSVILMTVILTTSVSAMSFLDLRGRVDILMYHRICEDKTCNNAFCISPETFEADLKYFKANGYVSMFASELAGADLFGKKVVVITFDDGYKSDLQYAIPLLEKYGYCASFYVYGGAVGTPGYMTEQDIKTMSEKACAEIGNHTYKLHANTPTMLNLLYGNPANDQAIVADFNKNREYLKSITGKDVITATYPNGEYSVSVDKILKSQGVLTTFSTEPYSFQKICSDKPAGRKTRAAGVDIKNLLR